MPFCPSCKYEYRQGINRCPDCNVCLVDELPPEPAPRAAMPTVELVRVASYPYEVMAQEARMRLEREGIYAAISNEKIGQTDMILAWADGGIHVVVPADDAARALEILENDAEQ